VTLDPAATDIDADLLVTKTSRDGYLILGSSLSSQLGATESIQNLYLSPGSYLILVSKFGDLPAAGSTYTLSVHPSFGNNTDGDSLADWWEITHFGDLLRSGNLDADKDGLSDLKEQTSGTHPSLTDTDGDGMPDGWEVEHRLNPLSNDASEDTDGDGKTNLQEFLEGTDPNPPKPMSWLPLLLD